MNAAGNPGDSTADADAAVAGSIVNSTATARIVGGSVTSGGALTVTATNSVDATTSGDARSATAGAGIALTNVTQTTSASIASNANVSATSLSVEASSDGIVGATAKSSPGGSTGNDESPSARTDDNAKSTASDSVPFAGALAFSRLSSVTEAFV